MTIASTQINTQASAAPPHNGFSLISNDKLMQIYSTMLRCRMLEERIRVLAKQNGLTEAYAAKSQEAAAVGFGVDLLPGDTLAPSPRGFIARLRNSPPAPPVPGPPTRRSNSFLPR